MNKLLIFKASWCKPCTEMKPIINELDQTRIEIYDIDHSQDVAREYGVSGVPCFLLVDENRNEIDYILGATTKDKLQALLYG